ncbi:MAG: DUF2807 domain-containing protein [Mucinivorans sp.]
MKHKLVIVLIFTLLVGSVNHSFSQQTIEIREQFSALTLLGPLHVEIAESDTCRAIITLHNTDAKSISWKNKNNNLEISLLRGIMNRECYASVKIYCNPLTFNRITSQGATVSSIDTLRVGLMQIIALSSVNRINLTLNCRELDADVSGDSQLKLKGLSDWAKIRVTMGGSVNCSKMVTKQCTALTTGGSNAIVNVTERLDAKATSNGTIYYFGEPMLSIKKTTLGDVKPIVTPE